MKVKKAIAFIGWLAVFIYMVASCISCSPKVRASKKLKRASRLIERAKQLDPSVTLTDTVIVQDTLITERVRVDTIVSTNTDTIRISKDRLKLKIVPLKDTLYVEAACEPDTIIRQVEVPVEVYIQKESFWQSLKWYYKAGIILFVVLLVVGIVKRFLPY